MQRTPGAINWRRCSGRSAVSSVQIVSFISRQSLTLSVDEARARTGRSPKPMSVAGVHRRHHRNMDIITMATITIIAVTAIVRLFP